MMANAPNRGAGDESESVGVILMTFGSPKTLNDVPAYLASGRGGKEAPDELVAEFQRRYRVIGGSPLLEISRRQAAALQEELPRLRPNRPGFLVTTGMRHLSPTIGEGLTELADAGVRDVVAIIMSPQYSPYIMGGYHRAVDDACARLAEGGRPVRARIAGDWHRNRWFQEALADRIREALEHLPADVRDTVPVLLTCHSLPKRVVDREPEYLEQIRDTVQAMVERLGLAEGRWQFAYQSAGHTPEEWLKPDMKDLLPGIRDRGHRHVVVAPVQFLADHLEILYDIDVAAREDAERLGIEFHRTESLNLSPKFIRALAEVTLDLIDQPALPGE
jgi:protoporphyrin/coproporphyrin ferrochelatase